MSEQQKFVTWWNEKFKPDHIYIDPTNDMHYFFVGFDYLNVPVFQKVGEQSNTGELRMGFHPEMLNRMIEKPKPIIHKHKIHFVRIKNSSGEPYIWVEGTNYGNVPPPSFLEVLESREIIFEEIPKSQPNSKKTNKDCGC